MTHTASAIDEPPVVKIGAGSFATVYVVRGGPIAYKQVAQDSDAQDLHREYDFLITIYTECTTDSFFAIPRALACNDPAAKNDGFVSTCPVPSSYARRRPNRLGLFMTPSLMAPFDRATYAMDRVHALPYGASKSIVRAYFPRSLQDATIALCRLYFGKVYPKTPLPKFVSTNNFPLDEQRYTKLFEDFSHLLQPADEVARGMGEILAKLHYKARVDGRDIEFVLGGTGGADFTYFIIDFNQVRAWTKGSDVAMLVSSFFDNDPYYPRPIPTNPLYTSFKRGYLEVCEPEDCTFAEIFLQAIEAEQAKRTSRLKILDGSSRPSSTETIEQSEQSLL
ncbi:hypothetical protein EIP91_005219 [Steccherinum ochraceum]|uniref:DUF3669 domain-containing protein n=1 Tax=Steccherinum ochraceum TaxID=92696 RepID=A0A4R0R7G6_9APHY|nr:hypothetical protein EIP91_005219 [Steccherinum ochraceum]